ncbi:hypothetical protein, partial [Achromobacter sp. Marseille-Q4962]|uniref:hypothetical protein n=1 Tax=Achromobacter sp. Marseille-Q4962 TaxID=2942202 RepID=UPI002073766C
MTRHRIEMNNTMVTAFPLKPLTKNVPPPNGVRAANGRPERAGACTNWPRAAGNRTPLALNPASASPSGKPL